MVGTPAANSKGAGWERDRKEDLYRKFSRGLVAYIRKRIKGSGTPNFRERTDPIDMMKYDYLNM